MGFPSEEYWSGLTFPFPRDLPDLGIEPMSPASPALTGRFFTTKRPGEPLVALGCCYPLYTVKRTKLELVSLPKVREFRISPCQKTVKKRL